MYNQYFFTEEAFQKILGNWERELNGKTASHEITEETNGKKFFLCYKCSKRFKTMSGLQKHNKIYNCPITF